MSKFEESNFYKALQDFFINADKKTFLQFLAEFYNRTESIIDKNNIQDDLIKELRELYLEFNENGIDENIVREKVNYFLESSLKIKDIISKLNTNTNNIENINSKLDTKANNIQNQINNLVLNGDGSQNLEVVQARGNHTVLNDRFSENENNLSSITVKIESKNKYNCNSVDNTNGKYLDYKGVLYEQAKTTITHFIDVKDGDVIRFIKNPYTSTNYGALYKIDGTFINNIKSDYNLTETEIKIDNWTKTLVTFTIPSNNSICKIKLNLETSNNNKYNMVTINEEMPTSFDKFISDYKLNGKKIVNLTTEIEKNVLNNKNVKGKNFPKMSFFENLKI